jgi:hypothetical protein
MSGPQPPVDVQPGAPAMEITPRDRFWMNFKLFQLVRFVVLNLKILKGVNASKRS